MEQKLWGEEPVGAVVSLIDTVTSKVVELSQPVNTLSWVALYTEPSTKASPDANNAPKLSYHWMLFPDATKSATVGESMEQKLWGEEPVGAVVSLIVTATSNLELTLQPTVSSAAQ